MLKSNKSNKKKTAYTSPDKHPNTSRSPIPRWRKIKSQEIATGEEPPAISMQRTISDLRQSERHSDENMTSIRDVLNTAMMGGLIPMAAEQTSTLQQRSSTFGRRNSQYWELDILPGMETVLSKEMIDWENTSPLVKKKKKKKPMKKQITSDSDNKLFGVSQARNIIIKYPPKDFFRKAMCTLPFDAPVPKIKKSNRQDKKSAKQGTTSAGKRPMTTAKSLKSAEPSTSTGKIPSLKGKGKASGGKSRKKIPKVSPWQSPISELIQKSVKNQNLAWLDTKTTPHEIRKKLMSQLDNIIKSATSANTSQPSTRRVSKTGAIIGTKSSRRSSAPMYTIPKKTTFYAQSRAIPSWRNPKYPRHPENRTMLISAGMMQMMREKRTLSRIRLAREIEDLKYTNTQSKPAQQKVPTDTARYVQQTSQRSPVSTQRKLKPVFKNIKFSLLVSKQSSLDLTTQSGTKLYPDFRSPDRSRATSMYEAEMEELLSSRSLRDSAFEAPRSLSTEQEYETQEQESPGDEIVSSELSEIDAVTAAFLRMQPLLRSKKTTQKKSKLASKSTTTEERDSSLKPRVIRYTTVTTTKAEMKKIAGMSLAAQKKYVPEHMKKKLKAETKATTFVPRESTKPVRRRSDARPESIIRTSVSSKPARESTSIRTRKGSKPTPEEHATIPQNYRLRSSIETDITTRAPRRSTLTSEEPTYARRSTNYQRTGSILDPEATTQPRFSSISAPDSTRYPRLSNILTDITVHPLHNLGTPFIESTMPARHSSTVPPECTNAWQSMITATEDTMPLRLGSSTSPPRLSTSIATGIPIPTSAAPETTTTKRLSSTDPPAQTTTARRSTGAIPKTTVRVRSSITQRVISSVSTSSEIPKAKRVSSGSAANYTSAAPVGTTVPRLSWGTTPANEIPFRLSTAPAKSSLCDPVEVSKTRQQSRSRERKSRSSVQKTASLSSRPPWRNARYTVRYTLYKTTTPTAPKQSLASKLRERRTSYALNNLPSMVHQNPESLIPPKRRPIPEWKKGTKSGEQSTIHKNRARRTTKRGLENKIDALRRSKSKRRSEKPAFLSTTGKWQKSLRRSTMFSRRSTKFLLRSKKSTKTSKKAVREGKKRIKTTEPKPLILNQYLFGKKLGSGSFGTVRLGENMYRDEPVAVKMEYLRKRKFLLQHEYNMYKRVGQTYGFPTIFKYEASFKNKYNTLTMELLGPSLKDVYDKMTKFSLKTVLQIIIQVLKRVEVIHRKGVLHRDIKPANFLIGRLGTRKERIIHMIDFGLSKLYRYAKGRHIPYRVGGGLCGTAKYASVNAHLGREQSRRDDMEACGYMFIYFARGRLPWEKLSIENVQKRYERICEIKRTIPLEELCDGLPPEFMLYMRYVKRLKFTEEPEYELLRNMFSELYYRSEFFNRTHFDWTDLLARERELKESEPIAGPSRLRPNTKKFNI